MADPEDYTDMISTEAVENKTQTVNFQQNNSFAISHTSVTVHSPARKKHKGNDRPALPDFNAHEHDIVTFTQRQSLLLEPHINSLQDYLCSSDRVYTKNLKAYYFAKHTLLEANKKPTHTFKYINSVVEKCAAKYNQSLISRANEWCQLTTTQQVQADNNKLTGGHLFTSVLMKHPFLYSACFASLENRSKLQKVKRRLEIICPICHQHSPIRDMFQQVVSQDKPVMSSKFRIHVKPLNTALDHLQKCHLHEHHINKFSNFTVDLHRLFYDIYHCLQGLGNDGFIEAITKDHKEAYPKLEPLQVPPEHDNDKEEREKQEEEEKKQQAALARVYTR